MELKKHVALSAEENIISSAAYKNKVLWWEKPLDEFTEMLQDLHTKHAPYFSRKEMEQVHNDVCQYAYQRGKMWESQIQMGLSSDYVQYLADDLTGYLRHLYQYLQEDIFERKGEVHLMSADECEDMVPVRVH